MSAIRSIFEMTIRNKLRISIGSIVVAIIAVYTTASYLAERHLLLQALDEKLLYSVEDVRGDLPADYHDRIVNGESVSPEVYAGIVNRNNNLCRTFGLQYLWSCMKIGDQVVFTTATSPSKDVAKRDYAPFLSVHSDPHAFDRAFETMKPVFGSFQNQWGHGRMILVPGWDRLGRPYCFGASVSVNAIQSELNKTLLHSLYLGIGFLLAGMVVSLLVSNSLAAPIVRLTEAADEIARGKMVQPIAAKGSTEILSLSRSLEAMEHSIRQKIGQLESEIAERKQAEKSLRESEGRNKIILYSAMDGFCVVDARGRIQEVNPSFCQMNGYGEQELLAMSISDLETVSPDIIAGRIQQILASGGLHFESRLRRKDGSHIDVEVSVQHEPSSGMLVAFHHDVTERKKANESLEQRVAERTEELKRSVEQYRMLFESSRDAIITTDTEGKCLDCNRAAVEIFGCADKAALLAMGLPGLSPEFQPDGRPTREAFLEVLSELRDKRSLFLEWQHQRADGKCFPAEIALSLFYVNGQPILHGMLRDITERKRAEEVVLQNVARAEELVRLKSRFVSMASHELRTPLTNILLACELLKNFGNAMPPERSQAVLSGLVAGVTSMERTLDDLLLAGKLEEGKLPFTPAPFPLPDFLRRCCLEAEPDLKLSSRIEIAIRDAVRVVAADERLLHRILKNLLENALKYSPPDTVVELGVEAGPDSLTLSVRDRGIGVPEAERKFLFDAFSRASNVGDKPGSGLGLFIAQKCAQAHGGELRYAPQPDGSVFSVTVPLSSTADMNPTT